MALQDFTLNLKANADALDQSIKKVTDRTYTVKLKADGSSIRTLTQDVTSADGKLQGVVKTMTKFDAQGRELNTTITQSAKYVKTWGQEFSDSFGKVLRFGTITAIIGAFTKAMYDAIDVVKEFDDAMTDLRKVSDLEGQALDDYTKKLGKLGETVARTRVEMTQNATIFKQAGYSDDDAATLARVAALYQNVADSEVSAQEAGQFVVSQLKAYGLAASDAASIVDKLNAVSNNYSVSNSDLAIGLTKSAAALQTLGNTQDEVMGLLTAGTEQLTGQASKVGKGLQTIGINIAQVATEAGELSYEVGNTTKTISLLDEATGDMRSTFDVLSDIAKDWNSMTDAQQTAISNALAGKTRFDVFAAVMTRFDDAISATTTSMKSFGSAEEENAKYMESMSAKIALLKQQFQELVLGDGGLEKVGKIFLDLGINTLKLVNDLGGLKTVLVALVGVIATIKADSVLNGLTKITNIIPNLIANVGKLGTVFNLIVSSQIDEALSGGAIQAMSLSQALQAAGVSASVAQVAIGGLFAVLTAGIAIYSRLKQEQEQATQNAIDSANSFKSYSDTLGNTLSKIQSESTTKSQLLEINKSLNDSYDNESEKLKDINDLRAENVELLHQEAVAKAEQTQHEIGAEATKQRRYLQSSNIGQESDYERVEGLTGTPEERLKKATGSLKEFEANQENLSNAELRRYSALSSYYNKLSADVENAKNVVETYDEAQKIANSSTDEWSKTVQENSAELENQGSQVQFTDEEIQQYADDMGISFEEAKDQLKSFNGGIDDTATDIDTLAKSIGVSVDELQNFADTMGLSIDSAAEILPRFNEWNEAVDDIQSSYEILTQAVEEYNEQGGYTTDTLQQLLTLDPAYLAALQEENGQLTINTQMLMTKVQAQAEEAKQIIYNTAIEKLNAVASGEAGNATETAGQQHNNAVAGIDAETGSLNENTKAKLANAVAEARGRGGGASEGEINKILSEMTNQLKAVDNWANTTAKNFSKGMGKAAKATNKATKAVKEQKSATETLKDKYKTVIDFIIKQYDKQIDKIKEAKDAAIKSVESQIKALEKEKDSKVKAIDAEITALQRERDAREKYWQDQLDKLEKENDERERNIALQEKQQALALAQQTNVMVLKDGQFQYTQDETAVSGAEQDLAQQEDQNEYERQKELIEELRDTELEWYDERIQSLEDYKDQVEEYYENQIEQLEEYKEYLEEYYEAQIEALKAEKDAVNETLEEGVANQQEYWDKMKEQLQSFVEEWNALVGEMTFPNISGSGISLSAVGGKITASMGGKSTGDNKVSAYASGKGSISDSEIAVVGENPKYRELVIGSKLNNDQGVVMNLKRGSGVVNAGTTNTLASIFNSLNGQKSVGQPVSNSNQSMSIQIGSINLPEVKDGQGFIDYLQNFSADITQQSFRRA
jgi:TP901 family phage tail tape measure protein|nr:MAG TPA: minor tail protein [Caudoviricetes sp.]